MGRFGSNPKYPREAAEGRRVLFVLIPSVVRLKKSAALQAFRGRAASRKKGWESILFSSELTIILLMTVNGVGVTPLKKEEAVRLSGSVTSAHQRTR